MSYQLLPNIILLFAIIGIIVLILRRLPEAAKLTEEQEGNGQAQGLITKSDLYNWYVAIKARVVFLLKRLWHFVLEAKGMRHQAVVGYRIKQIFKKSPRRQSVDGLSVRDEPQGLRDENYYVQRIKQDPQDLENYRSLGEYYLDTENYTDAANVFEYLVNHDAGNSAYYAKFGYAKLRLELFDEAAKLFEKSVTLDATHPNRYYNLALAYEGSEKFAEALAAAAQAVALEPLNKKYQSLHADLDNRTEEWYSFDWKIETFTLGSSLCRIEECATKSGNKGEE